ncbi:glycosyltransferase family 4 protein [Ornithinimicrobium sufpigmenti]|uniref:glycosyltransferase family 4 protein n=1 Tax=Ornithinimicrobium sufpigmenti TaxID=2508882 RepID=UPI0010356143|nr:MULTISPECIES: glycosyltransferase family 4 protein [unclassified Ornithinimicrobium]
MGAKVRRRTARLRAPVGRGERHPRPQPLILIANPSADVYGSDLQMLESVTALIQAGYEVVVTTPTAGPLVDQLVARGATVEHLHYPVLRKAQASVGGILRLGWEGARSSVHLARHLRRRRPAWVYVNTVTLPWWILGARLARVPVACHVHEAERREPLPMRLALYAPLLAAHRCLANSRATLQTLVETVPPLGRRAHLIYNGVPGPTGDPGGAPVPSRSFRVALVARLSPRKGVDIALEAVGLVRQAGHDVRLIVCGTPFAGYEWFEEQLRRRAEAEDLRGAVTFAGYVSPVWPVLRDAHAVLATSLGESLGNAVIEAQLSGRPVIASDVCGHDETVQDGVTGLLVPASDPSALAAGIVRLMDGPELADHLAQGGRRAAQERFSVARYHQEIRTLFATEGQTAEKSRRFLALS